MYGPFGIQGNKPKPQPPRRIKRFTITVKQLAELLEGGTHTREVREGMPKGARIQGVVNGVDPGVLIFTAEHDDFDPIPEGQEPPEARISVLPAKPPEAERTWKHREWT